MSGPPPLPGEQTQREPDSRRTGLAQEWALYWRGSLIWSFLLGASLVFGVPENRWAAAGLMLFMAFVMYPFFLLARWAFGRNVFLAVAYGLLLGMSPILAMVVCYIFIGLAKLVDARKQFGVKFGVALLIYGLAVSYATFVPATGSGEADSAAEGDTNTVLVGDAGPTSTVLPASFETPVTEPAPEAVSAENSMPVPAPASGPGSPAPAVVVEQAPAPAPPAPVVLEREPEPPPPPRKPKVELSEKERLKLEAEITEARTMLRTTGVIKRGGEYRALVNDQVLGKGDMIPVNLKGKTYTFIIAEIDAKNVSFEPVIEQ